MITNDNLEIWRITKNISFTKIKLGEIKCVTSYVCSIGWYFNITKIKLRNSINQCLYEIFWFKNNPPYSIQYLILLQKCKLLLVYLEMWIHALCSHLLVLFSYTVTLKKVQLSKTHKWLQYAWINISRYVSINSSESTYAIC